MAVDPDQIERAYRKTLQDIEAAVGPNPWPIRNYLVVRRGKRRIDTAFHPAIRIENTGYGRHQIVGQTFQEGVFVGYYTMEHYGSIENAIKHYFSELKRMGHEPLSGDISNEKR